MARRDIYDLEHWLEVARKTGHHPGRLAKEPGIPVRTLRRYIRMTCKTTLGEWLRRDRMKGAKEALLEKHEVKWAAAELKFKTVAHFSRVFKRVYKLSPTAFLEEADRKRHGLPPPPPPTS